MEKCILVWSDDERFSLKYIFVIVRVFGFLQKAFQQKFENELIDRQTSRKTTVINMDPLWKTQISKRCLK